MLPPDFKPGDRVVELAGVVTPSALVTGALSGAWIGWTVRKDWPAPVGAFVAGAMAGYALAQVINRLFYRTADGQTTIAKVGPASLQGTIPAGLLGGIPTAGLVTALSMPFLDADSQTLVVPMAALACGVVIGLLFACLSSLL